MTNPGNESGQEYPLLLSIGGVQVLAYEGEEGIRVASWKYPERVDGEVFIQYEIEDAPRLIAARRYRTIHELEDVLRALLP
jgi:hypothetical protein